jgi:hypothetical protein
VKDAKAALAQGASRDKVEARLKEMGVDPSLLKDAEAPMNPPPLLF